MANLTRLEIVDELKTHGWSRYLDASLQRYVDWGLQRTYSEGSFDRSVRDETTVPATTLDQISFTAISIGSAELVQSIRQVMVRLPNANARKLRYASDSYFERIIRPNMEATTPLDGYPGYYYVWDLNVVLYPKPNPAIDVIVDWMRRKDVFTSDADTTGLPERFDKIVLAWTESYCHRRAREFTEQLNLERSAREMMLVELGQEMSVAQEGSGRVRPWGR